MKPHPRNISTTRILRNPGEQDIITASMAQAREMTERLKAEAPETLWAVTHQVLSLTLYLHHLQLDDELNTEGLHVLQTFREICDTAGLEIDLRRVSTTPTPQQDHL